MISISPAFPQFFAELERNNHKEWFDANKKRYERDVKIPFTALVHEVLKLVSATDPTLENLQPKDCIFRINRDIRFSKDKTPYKIYASAAIARGGRKHMDIPGFYFEIGASFFAIYGGLYGPEKSTLDDVRYYIAGNREAFRKCISQGEFVKYFGEIRGEKNKILPVELKAAAADEPLIFNKQFYFFRQIPVAEVLENPVEAVMENYRIMKPVNDFLSHAVTH
jgi:uncharacterized protein (TIGR02453 family)